MKFSVLLPVYGKDHPKHFEIALQSILDQTVPPNEVVVIKDGPLSSELEDVLNTYLKTDQLFKIVSIDKNAGLGEALRLGLENCTHDIVARMDSDDYSLPFRFERQLEILSNNPDIDLVGSYIAEFEGELDDIRSIRAVPSMSSEIRRYARHRNPINHVTVMFRKEAVLKAGGYKHFSGFEDYYLWMRMLSHECSLFNIPSALVLVRVDNNMFKRRGGADYIKSEKRFQRELLEGGYISLPDFIINSVVRRIARTMPIQARKMLYRSLLREKYGKVQQK